MKNRVVIASLLAAGLLSGSASGQDWTFGPSLNLPRALPASAVDGCGDIIVAGGDNSGQQTNEVEWLAFDPGTRTYANSWVAIEPLNEAREGAAAIGANGFFYIAGGSADTVLASVERLDTTLGMVSATWELIEPMAQARVVAAITVDLIGRIWVIGGTDGADQLDSVEIYDPARPDLGWVAGPTLQTAREKAGAVTDLHGRIWVFGGQNRSDHLTSVEVIDSCDPEDSWATHEIPIGGPNSNEDWAVLGADGRVYLVGGWLPGFTERVVRFDPKTEAWEDWADLNVARANLCLVRGANGSIWAIGGAPATDVVEVLTAPCGAADVRPHLMDSDGNGTKSTSDLLDLLGMWGMCL